jgi:hypothetical protein
VKDIENEIAMHSLSPRRIDSKNFSRHCKIIYQTNNSLHLPHMITSCGLNRGLDKTSSRDKYNGGRSGRT